MNPTREQLEARLHYPLGATLPEPGHTLEVAPGVKWIRMALPFALDHINLWLLRDQLDGREGWTVVDCCISHDAAKAQWETIFANELDGLPVLRVIVTHMHPDHIGLADWLCERWSGRAAGPPQGEASPLGGQRHGEAASVGAPVCRLWVSATDFTMARIGSQSTTGFGGEAAAAFFASQGLSDPESLEKIRGRASYYPNLVPSVPAQYRRLYDGLQVPVGGRLWRCISGYGHAPEHMALYCETLGVLISGDMVLPRISTNVSVYDQEPEADSLTLFLDSLKKYLPLPADTLVLPSHGKPFTGLHERIQQLQDHHRDRLDEVRAACREKPCSGADILPVLFPRALDLHQTTFAMGEAVAHLHWLWMAGELVREQDADGVWRFSPASRRAAPRQA
ncbi:MAG: MBL fold metallo-hydrolase [Hydrogenophaga sp.]|uniref:MBL fold metallo-hydrolase n=1 Tax=Hydrogenophaga sp. TaxID=1904254 RepID=UPI002AB810E9|nr:MBL fold metallo-hydrolase [Hydrogenophaga sp.]MDZ4282011.1 MBL fold metallo-hydrolase [Hydrogenophaga sp.]